ncbi:hypothetical protein ACA910_000965 [Epithemia clementina (nom. ined.)]
MDQGLPSFSTLSKNLESMKLKDNEMQNKGTAGMMAVDEVTSPVKNECDKSSEEIIDHPSSKKKARKKKIKSAEGTLPQSSGDDAVANGRPGKKKLRKLRFQQNHLSPFDFNLVSAKNSVFTSSVFLGPNMLDQERGGQIFMEQNSDHQISNAGTRILEVSTSGSIPPLQSNSISSRSEDVHKYIVHVQPLLVLDLNGILCHRVRHNRAPNTPKSAYRHSVLNVANTPVVPRTDLHDFLSFLDRNFCLGVWTSAKNRTAIALVSALFPSDVASRLLFVWAQHHCDTIQSDGGDDDGLVFEKNLTKVWKEFPLWNVNNTVLIDDSPDKCTQWHANAVHPPPLNGLRSDWEGNSMPDEVNERQQRLFFDGLAAFWKRHKVVQTWDEESGDATTYITDTSNGREESLHDSNGLLQYLKQRAVGHMGWK